MMQYGERKRPRSHAEGRLREVQVAYAPRTAPPLVGIGFNLHSLQITFICTGLNNITDRNCAHSITMLTSIEQAIEIINRSNHIVAFSGAGVSTEAGIPDFRSKGGWWEDEHFMELMSSYGFDRDPAGFYQAALTMLPGIHRAKPTEAHRLLAQLERQGKLTAVVTQNIDGLHQAAGSRTVYEIHGNFRTGHCVDCRATYPTHSMIEFYDQIERGEIAFPTCKKCASPIKPDVVLIGDIMPQERWNASVAAVKQCDLMLALGSSLVIYPAAELPAMAIANGARLI